MSPIAIASGVCLLLIGILIGVMAYKEAIKSKPADGVFYLPDDGDYHVYFRTDIVNQASKEKTLILRVETDRNIYSEE